MKLTPNHNNIALNSKLGRIDSNVFECHFFEFEKLNSKFKFGRIWLIEFGRIKSK